MAKYVSFSKDDFEFGLLSIQRELTLGKVKEINIHGSWEYVYEMDTADPRVKIRIYSSVSKMTNRTREKGTDAIRCVVNYKGTEIFRGTAHTKRLATWRKNLQEKIVDLTQKVEEMPSCPLCQSAMTIRKGPRGKFWGCIQFPRCKGTINLK